VIRKRADIRRVLPWLLLPLPVLALLGASEGPLGQVEPAARGVQSPHGPLKADCTQCHATESWRFVAGRGFEHDSTGYALVGAHAEANCDGCHADLRFGRVASACADCHLDIHAGELGFDCAGCHTPQDWEPTGGALALHAARGFPLLGVHAQVDCEACHVGAKGEEFAGTPSDCYACHAADYAATTAPDHAAAGMSTDCLGCHSSVAPGWGDSNFAHGDFFPLSGAHARLDCLTCHQSGFGGQPTSCIGCHQSDYDSTDDPGHAAAGFSTECQSCHSTQAWSPATFNHANTAFPLTGAHTSASCLDCHGGGYSGTPTDCYACHQADFEGTTEPNHVTSGFGTGCLTCHSTQAWSPSTWDHDQLFPIYSGKHRGKWDTCADCHVQPTNYAIFECIFCHEHNQNNTDDHHNDVNDYVYESNACFTCHPDGSE